MEEEPKREPYYIPGYGGFYPQLCYHLGNTTSRLLTHPSVMRIPPTQPPTQTTDQPPKLHHSHAGSLSTGTGHQPMLQFRHAASFSRTVTNAVDDFLEVRSSATGLKEKRPGGDGSAKDSYTTRHWKPKAEHKSSLTTYVMTPKINPPHNLQRNAIPGYTGFIPRYHWSMGVGFAPGVKESMDEFDRRQIQMRSPLTSLEQRMKETYWPKSKIYSPAGLLPKYTGFVPGSRDTFGTTYGNTTRQLYIKYPL
ncbi:protein FAM166A isoform X2 [Hyla sarda]|uniref:protein FAM166A isoform X2 n=1 Tax=Hyla sarda TaxID=327740 RepID=UPI0024C2D786|nr:protein FAM166A isoform X2 [Hyla sarda]